MALQAGERPTPPAPDKLRGRAAVVAGGTGFLGRDIVAALLDAGCRVAVIDRDAGDRTLPEGCTFVECDLTDATSAETAFGRIWNEFGAVQILVNAAGAIRNAPLVNPATPGDRRHSFDLWRETIDANLTCVFLATVNQVDRMIASRTRGVVVSLSSIAAAGNAGQSAYSAAKAGVNAVTAAWAKELGIVGIRFVAIAPGFIDTESTRTALSDGTLKEWTRKTPLRRLGKAEEVTSAVLFAIMNDHLTGKVLEIDGGLTL